MNARQLECAHFPAQVRMLMADTPRRIQVLVVFGTKPETLKLAPMIREPRARICEFECAVCFSGQLRELGGQAFAACGLKPNIEWNAVPTAFHSRLLLGTDGIYPQDEEADRRRRSSGTPP